MNTKQKAKKIYDSLEGANNKRHQFLYQLMCDSGITPTQAIQTLYNLKKCKYSTIERLWREYSKEEEKDRVKEEEFRVEYSAHETAKRIRQEKDPNLSIFN